jgi:Sulfatase-modifying factor enzyme 1
VTEAPSLCQPGGGEVAHYRQRFGVTHQTQSLAASEPYPVARVIEAKANLRSMGRQRTSDGSRVGVCCARRNRWRRFHLGNEYVPDGKAMANTWQGEFPSQKLLLDGYEGTAPVGFFPPNGYDLCDMAVMSGNGPPTGSSRSMARERSSPVVGPSLIRAFCRLI